jgi:hypothetical protein
MDRPRDVDVGPAQRVSQLRRVLATARDAAPSSAAASLAASPSTDFAREEAERLAAESTQWNAPADIRTLREARPGADVPIIDLGPYLRTMHDATPSGAHAHTAARRDAAEQLRRAATQVGFHYVVNHGVSAKVVDNAIEACRLFHETTPPSEKMRHHLGTAKQYQGVG